MRNSKTTDHAGKRYRKGGTAPAFTIIELSLVVAILVLLMAILMPAFSGAKKHARSVASQAWINDLASGARQYAMDNNNFFPGQRNPTVLDMPSDPDDQLRTGSQLLAEVMFFDNPFNPYEPNDYDPDLYADPADIPIFVEDPNYAHKSIYAKWEQGNLIHTKVINGADRFNTISDRFGNLPMPILYYPARAIESGLGQYHVLDNAVYTDPKNPVLEPPPSDEPNPPVPTSLVWLDWRTMSFRDDPNFNVNADDPNNLGRFGFENFIRDTRFKGAQSTEPYNPREFLIIGAGKDRIYGTQDDLKNW